MDPPYTLYYAPGTASLAVHWLLIESNIPFSAIPVDLASGAQHTAAYRQLNPTGRVPTLVINASGEARSESSALLMLLAERHPDRALMPAVDSPDRALWLETMIYLANTLLPAMRDWFYAATDGSADGAAAVRDLARRRIEGAWDRLDGQVQGGGYLVGTSLSTADFLAVMLMRWARDMPRPATSWPSLGPYARQLTELPSFREVCRREGLAGWPPVSPITTA
ncbi:glutathione S-transferase [Aspergillus heteromorphus CBS 117.55]|uniref:Glutathione S-transferase n=1 Tax=Aspergillus heteromorphus CBS 117.55 TaxID=1448321 RepID=A0A317WR84_9EURO|nr:glutathione S-transferase [Aspergillus heteromorphus CBS 117.55]PWY88953.1 glutathione S-transferase [Aspergillus heteromorphus CBS 117.55]